MRSLVQQSGYVFDHANRIWLRPDFSGTTYSDGDEAEARIASVIAQAHDLSVLSPELPRHCTDWPSLYHLGRMRANLLRPLAQLLRGDVLEVGAGCGAITRYLGECGARVLALEGSLRRAAIARSRTRDLENVTVLAEDFSQFQCDHRFAVVTMIGVLEYAGLSCAGENAALQVLKQARSLLEPEGTLVLAIENQLGLKYFAGAPEDHLGQPMVGVEGRYRDRQPRTFGRSMLSSLLESAGFSEVEFLAPFPDYKLPVSIVTETGFRSRDFDASAMAWQSVRSDPQLPPYCGFSLELAWPQVFANELGLDLANSFLLVASPQPRPCREGEILAFHYSVERLPEYCKETAFVRTADEDIQVQYGRLGPSTDSDVASASPLSFNCGVSATYAPGTLLALELVRVVTNDGWGFDNVARFVWRYAAILEAIARKAGRDLHITSQYEKIPGSFFDAIPQNIIVHRDGTHTVIDTEWELNFEIEVGYLLFRSLLSLTGSITRFGRPSSATGMTNRHLVEGVFAAAGMGLHEGDLARYLALEAQVQQWVSGRAMEQALELWQEYPLRTEQLSQAIHERDARIARLNDVISDQDRQISNAIGLAAERDKQLADLGSVVAGRDAQIESIGRTLFERDGQLELIGRMLSERDARIVSLELKSADQDRQVVGLQQTIRDRELCITELTRMRAEHEGHVRAFEADLLARDSSIASLRHELTQREGLVADLSSAVARLESQNSQLLFSNSWRFTAPLRAARRIAAYRTHGMFRKGLSDCSRKIWRNLPISMSAKQQIKERLFRSMPFAFSWSAAYRNWERYRVARHPQDSVPCPAIATDPRQPASPEPEFVPLLHAPPLASPSVRLIAFYLPQYHPIPENDNWWGEGFTEWSNVRPAQPQFDGHYQPRIPGDLGYYNLLDEGVQKRQVELARLYGVGGFCFYFYWFGGRTLLEQPVQNYLDDASLTLPFCLCWANENWSRRWDGLEREILMAQHHSPEDDLAFIEHVSRCMRDGRYIRIGGKPLLVVYRPGLLPSAAETAGRWRTWCRQNGIGEIFLAYTQSFDTKDPSEYGFDAAIEFPPNNSSPPLLTNRIRPSRPDFACTVYDWDGLVERSCRYADPGYPIFRSVCPSWDNTARRRNAATIFVNSSPDRYRVWLSNAIDDTRARFAKRDEQLVFVNAWNEWAEGAYLEPDVRYGYAYLDATRRALSRVPVPSRKIVVVSHDAHPHGAQFLTMAMARHLKTDLHLDIEIVLLGPGRLREDFEALAPVHELNGERFDRSSAMRLAESLRERGFARAIVSTTASGLVVPVFHHAGIDCACLIHELPGVIQDLKLESKAREIARFAKVVVFPAQVVADGFARFAAVPDGKAVIRPQGLYRRNSWRFDRDRARAELCRRIGLPTAVKIVLAVGYADHRKGVDLFVDCAFAVSRVRDDVHFIWVGHREPELERQTEARICGSAIGGRVHFVGYDPETALYHAGADLYALTSREDPFPNVILESLEVGVPVVAFASSGGGALLVEQVGGRVIPPWDVPAFAEALCHLLDNREALSYIGETGRACIDTHYSFRQYLFDVCGFLGISLPRVTVVVPNYNYAKYIEERLDTIRQQSYPIYELIILDDGSTDGSLDKIAAWLDSRKCEARVVASSANSGSVFGQWREGLRIASGGYVWVAEADDLSAPDFLECVMPPLLAGDVVLSYCESQQIDSEGRIVAENYHDYLRRFSADRWSFPYQADGVAEVRSFLSIANTIPNASAVVFRREVLCEVFEKSFDEIARFKRAGDWVVYFRTLLNGRIAYTPRAANYHRRHDTSVIGASGGKDLYREIESVQDLIASEMDIDADVRHKASSYLRELSMVLNGDSVAEVSELKG